VDFPVSVTCVAGTQAGKVTANNIVVFRMSNLHTVRPTGTLVSTLNGLALQNFNGVLNIRRHVHGYLRSSVPTC